jgi:hypothetical protein
MELLLPLPKTEIQNLFNMKVLSCTKDVPFSSIFFMLFSKQFSSLSSKFLIEWERKF